MEEEEEEEEEEDRRVLVAHGLKGRPGWLGGGNR